MQYHASKPIAITSLLLMCLGSCKKPATQSPVETASHTYTDSATLKAYYFRPGTYWIYADSVTGQTDSYAVVSSVNKVYRDYIYGMHSTYVDSTSYYVSYIVSENIDHTSSEQHKCKWVLDRHGINYYYYINDSAEGPFYLSPHLWGYGFDTITYSTHGVTYDSLLDAKGYGHNEQYLLAKHIGMVKMVLPEQNHTWELIRYHVVQ